MSWVQEQATIIANTALDDMVSVLSLHAPRIAAVMLPGQFLMLHPPISPYLPRAMAPLSWDPLTGDIIIVVRVVGPGTRELQALQPDGLLSVTGPLGQALTTGPGPWALVGRGVGIAPLLPWAYRLASAQQEVRFYLSARHAALLLAEDEFRSLGCLRRHLDVEDPHHVITDELVEDIAQGWVPQQILVCGSQRLIQNVASIQRQYAVSVSVLLEEKMACGIGWCKGCASGEQWSLLCVDGPTRPMVQGVVQ